MKSPRCTTFSTILFAEAACMTYSAWQGQGGVPLSGRVGKGTSPGIPLCWVGWWERQGSGKAGLGSEESRTWLILQILWIYPQITNLILFWLVVFFNRITKNKLYFGTLHSPDFWCPWTSPSIWTFLSLSRSLKLDVSGMAWRNSQRQNAGPDPMQSQSEAIVSWCLFLLAFPYNAKMHLYCWMLLLRGFLAQW